MDIKRSARQDLSLPKVRDSYLDRIRAKEFDAILLSPPCASFSRATWAKLPWAAARPQLRAASRTGEANWSATHWPTRGAPARLDVAVAAASRPVEKGAQDCGFPPS